MTTTVWKAQLIIADEQEIEVPAGAEMLHAAVQNDVFCVWYRCDPGMPRVRRRMRIARTGHPISDEPWHHVGSCFVDGGALVFHIFELRP